ncbi:MAG: ribonuclease HII [Candidatus Aenigmatarchaeota archaeon]
MLTLGIDEAGRGAVLGSLVICGAVFEESDLPSLKLINVKDSKLLSPLQRRTLKPQIEKIAKMVMIEKLEAHEIDEKRAAGTNLNMLETLKFVSIINAVFKKMDIGKVVIDVPDTNLKKYNRMLSGLIKRDDLKIVGEHHADLNHVECSAASVIAKVTRDAEIEELKKDYGDFGAGYPSDPKCINWLKERLKADGSLPKIVRHSWETVAKLNKKKSQTTFSKFTGVR